MSKLSYTDIKEGVYIVLNKTPYEVIESVVAKKSRQKASNQTKIKDLISGNVISHTFRASDTIDSADIERKDVEFIYKRNNTVWFNSKGNKNDRFEIEIEKVKNIRFMKEYSINTAKLFGEEIFEITTPIKVDLVVTKAPPNIKGNTAQGGTKRVTLETGEIIPTPLFINEGDEIRINTKTGEYVERVKKN